MGEESIIKVIKYIEILLALIVISFINGGLVLLFPHVGWQIWIGTYTCWFLIACICDKYYLHRFLKQGIFLVLFVSILLVYGISINELNSPNTTPFIQLFMLYSIYFFYKSDKNYQKIIVNFFLIECTIKCLYSIWALTKDPMLARNLLTGQYISPDINPTITASFSFVYLGIPFIVYFLNQCRYIKNSYKIGIYLLILLFITLIIKANFATALIIMIYFIILSLITKSTKQLFIYISISFLSFFIFKPAISRAFYNISNLNNISPLISAKMYEISAIIMGGSSNSTAASLGDRIIRMKESMNAFYSHPLWGIYGMDYQYITVGAHTTWQDMLGKFGLLRNLPIFIFFIQWYKEITYSRTNREFYAIVLTLVSVIAMGFMDPILQGSILVFLLVIIPMCRECFLTS